jgi:hypothetical protein
MFLRNPFSSSFSSDVKGVTITTKVPLNLFIYAPSNADVPPSGETKNIDIYPKDAEDAFVKL